MGYNKVEHKVDAYKNFVCVTQKNDFMPSRHIAVFSFFTEWYLRFPYKKSPAKSDIMAALKNAGYDLIKPDQIGRSKKSGSLNRLKNLLSIFQEDDVKKKQRISLKKNFETILNTDYNKPLSFSDFNNQGAKIDTHCNFYAIFEKLKLLVNNMMKETQKNDTSPSKVIPILLTPSPQSSNPLLFFSKTPNSIPTLPNPIPSPVLSTQKIQSIGTHQEHRLQLELFNAHSKIKQLEAQVASQKTIIENQKNLLLAQQKQFRALTNPTEEETQSKKQKTEGTFDFSNIIIDSFTPQNNTR